MDCIYNYEYSVFDNEYKTKYNGIELNVKYNCYKINIEIEKNQGIISLIWSELQTLNGKQVNGMYIDIFKSSIKGMGKYILCMAISIGLAKKLIKYDKVYLEAVPLSSKIKNYLSDDLDPETLYNVIENYGYLKKMNEFYILKEYDTPEKLKNFIKHSPKIVQEKLNKLFSINDLMNYYRTYGFNKIKGKGSYMVADLKDIVKNCNGLI
jgi:hypothetical protein